ncbi:hypothetical protein EB796_001515 [Bugula neritina]|uniref:Uncharacterized protein n=1 Tax=Bugula neritina TaxID=10212 RepID=A0A7J7KPS8_BUGNE|nr:hypothetical protein EB796_001515 [Bugula neritina]
MYKILNFCTDFTYDIQRISWNVLGKIGSIQEQLAKYSNCFSRQTSSYVLGAHVCWATMPTFGHFATIFF